MTKIIYPNRHENPTIWIIKSNHAKGTEFSDLFCLLQLRNFWKVEREKKLLKKVEIFVQIEQFQGYKYFEPDFGIIEVERGKFGDRF